MKRIRIAVAILAATAVVAITPDIAAAQCTAGGAPASCGVPGSASMTAGRVVQLQMSAGSTPLTAPTPADFDAGFNSTSGPTLTVSANSAWTLHIRAAAPSWTGTDTSPGAPARTNKPAGDLQWATSSGGPFAALTASDASLVAGSAAAGDATTLYFHTRYDWTLDTPGNYTL